MEEGCSSVRIARTVLKRMNSEEDGLPRQRTVIKTLWYWHRKRWYRKEASRTPAAAAARQALGCSVSWP